MHFLGQLCQHKLPDIVRTYSGYAHEILQDEYSSGSDSSTRVYHSFMQKTPVFPEYLAWLRSGRPELLQFVLTFLLYGKKLEYEDEEFNATALRGWYEVEDKLSTLVIPADILLSLKTVTSVLIDPLRIDHLLPKFGPGKVSEKGILDVNDKLRSLRMHPRLMYAFNRLRPKRGLDEGFGRFTALGKLSRSRDFSRTKFVRRDMFKSRTICMEPNIFMYFQQEVMRWMVQTMETSLINRFVKLDEQAVSQQAALHGSAYLSTDTIDLSNASDSVHVDLVRGVFPSDWKFYMMATRTSKVLLPGTREPVEVTKFAPMGSAVCFPTQCIVFTAVCILGYMLRDRRFSGNPKTTVSPGDVRDFIRNRLASQRGPLTPFGVRYEPPVVYGDDIAVDSRTTDDVISLLSVLGFTVNRSKSFTGSQSFRESCGVFAFEGQDVTPVQFRISFFERGVWSPQVYASFIGAYNQHKRNGYHGVAAFLLGVLKDYGFKYPLPFVTKEEEFGLFTHSLGRSHEGANRFGHKPLVLKREAKDEKRNWQIYETCVQGIGPARGEEISPTDPSFDTKERYRLDQWWRKGVRDTTTLDFTKGLRIRPQETRLRARWARCE